MAHETIRRLKVRCPECLAPIWLKDNLEQWDPVTCPECHSALEVVSVHPPALDYIMDYDDYSEDDWDIGWE